MHFVSTWSFEIHPISVFDMESIQVITAEIFIFVIVWKREVTLTVATDPLPRITGWMQVWMHVINCVFGFYTVP